MPTDNPRSIVTYVHRQKRPLRKKAQAAAITGSAIVTAPSKRDAHHNAEFGTDLVITGCLFMLAGIAQLLGLLVRRLIRGPKPAVTGSPSGRSKWSIFLWGAVGLRSPRWGVIMIGTGFNLFLTGSVALD
jgi:hypothetical protein